MVGPSWNTQEEGKVRGGFRGNGDLHAAVPGVICFLRDFQCGAVVEAPVEFGIIVEVEINSFRAGAVEIAGKRGKSALDIGGATGGVVPEIANFPGALAMAAGRVVVGEGRLELQRSAIAVESAIERHTGINGVVERALDHIGE